MKGSMFVRIHNSYLINMEKLKEVEREKVILRSGAESTRFAKGVIRRTST